MGRIRTLHSPLEGPLRGSLMSGHRRTDVIILVLQPMRFVWLPDRHSGKSTRVRRAAPGRPA